MKKLFLLFYTLCCSLALHSQSTTDIAIDNYLRQLSILPQEKIYIQTDKPYYITGEKVFFRAFLLNAANNQPAWFSRYIYVELINPLDSVITRQQIRPDTVGLFYSALSLPIDMPQGNYRLRAYTRYMENFGESVFFSKPVFIANSNAMRFKTETEFETIDRTDIGVSIRFIETLTGKPSQPKQISLRINGKTSAAPPPDKNGWINVKFKQSDIADKRILCVEHVQDGRVFSKYIYIPFPGNTVDVSFYPEGGNIIANMPCRVAFKALAEDGNSVKINGEILNSQNEFITKFETLHDGMGSFTLTAQHGEKYHAVCAYKEKIYTFDLPQTQNNTYSLKTVWNNDKLMLFVNKPAEMPTGKLYLLIHNQGNLLHFDEWDFSKNVIVLDKSSLHTGVQHFLLMTETFEPVSERLVFVNKSDLLNAKITAEKQEFAKREKVKMNIELKETDIKNINFSISITDDNDVQIDTTTNLPAEILLASELKGSVNNPAFYFRDNDEETGKKADLLMLTHGWNRYDIPKILQGKVKSPKVKAETSQYISGRVTNNLSRKYKGAKVMVFSPDIGFLAETETDENGNFTLNDFEYPDSTGYVVQATSRKNKGDVLLYLDNIEYPYIATKYKEPAKALDSENKETKESDFMDYLENTNTKYIENDDVWRMTLDELVVTAKRIEKKKPEPKTFYGFEPNHAITKEEIEQFPPSDLHTLLARLPGVIVRGDNVRIIRSLGLSLGGDESPLFVVDGIKLSKGGEKNNQDKGEKKKKQEKTELNIFQLIDVNQIEQVNLITSVSKLVIYGNDATSGVIEIFTKGGARAPEPQKKLNIKDIKPLGYQKPVEFYSPKYDTQEAINSKKIDIRSTIYWKPNVQLEKTNKTTIDFYTADMNSNYSVVIEGISETGNILYLREKAIIKVR